jgi:uncharacterized protein YjbJ (UPF0337 family)
MEWDEAEGTMKEKAGELTDDKQLEGEGKAQGAMGDAKEKAGDAKDAIGDKADDLSDKI